MYHCEFNASMEALLQVFCSSKHTLFITGSGISTASGLPTYRGVGGLYQNNFIPPEIRMSEFVFRWFPSLTWGHFHKVLRNSENVRPNQAHIQLAKIQNFLPKVTILTQNVDGLHQDAGSENVIEIHGSARSLMCPKCSWKDPKPNFKILSRLPRCPDCGTIVRPPVVLFGGNLPDQAVKQMEDIYDVEPDLVVGIGTTAMFQYILDPFKRAYAMGHGTVIIDPNPASHLTPYCKFVVRENAETFLPYLFKQVVRDVSAMPKPNWWKKGFTFSC